MPTVKINLGRVKGTIWYSGVADGSEAIASEVAASGHSPIAYDMYMNASNGDVWQYLLVSNSLQWVLRGNIRGAKGEGFEIKKTYDSVSAMNAGYATDGVPLYGFVLIDTGDVNDEENAQLYVKGDTAYNYLTDLSGAQGIKGEKGDTGLTPNVGMSVSVDETTGTPSATVTRSGTAETPSFAIAFSGLKGADGKTPTLSISNGNLIATFD